MKIYYLLISMILTNNLTIYCQEINSNFFSLLENKFISDEEIKKQIQESQVIYVGETHDQNECHIAQLKTIMTINEIKQGKVAVGFEMLNSTLQPILDEYAEGKISDEEFLTKVNWKKEWGFDFSLYEPIFSYIRANKLKALALNVPRNIISKIARTGIDSLDENEKKLIANKVKINKDKRYIDFLKESYNGHGNNPMSNVIKWENYLYSMATWNETMGERIVNFIDKNKDYAFVVILGNGHVMYNAAVPWSVKKRIKKIKHLSIYTENIENKDKIIKEKEKVADIVWFVKFENSKNQ